MIQEILSKQHCGLIKCPFPVVEILMPDLWFLFQKLPSGLQDHYVDIKVHKLMPKQFPCIPDWHYDLVPRDENNIQQFHLRDPKLKMYMLVTGHPLPEFRDGRNVEPMEWIEFTQFDEHRGTSSEMNCWRLFARVSPPELVERQRNINTCIRRHCQVYLDSKNYQW